MRDIIKDFKIYYQIQEDLEVLIGLYLNSLVSYYVILLDTQDLIFSIEELNSGKVKIIKKPYYQRKKLITK